jgi:hypothetical protein
MGSPFSNLTQAPHPLIGPCLLSMTLMIVAIFNA